MESSIVDDLVAFDCTEIGVRGFFERDARERAERHAGDALARADELPRQYAERLPAMREDVESTQPCERCQGAGVEACRDCGGEGVDLAALLEERAGVEPKDLETDRGTLERGGAG